MKRCLLMLALVPEAPAAVDFWDLAPISYSDTAPTGRLARRAAEYATGARKPEGEGQLDRLRFILRELGVPEESQVLVFSKTSHQNPLIHPANPRALFFSPEAYVGYVPGGAIETITHDPVLGVVFHLIEPGPGGTLKVTRDSGNCLSCHGTTRTEGVPGMLVRSVMPNADGHPLLALGTSHVTHETPLEERWGGYFVTGRSSLPHLGNRTFDEEGGGDTAPATSDLDDLAGMLDVSKYPRATSDIVALMVLEHQCLMHNLLTSAALNHRRAWHMGRAIDPEADPDQGAAGRVADSAAEKIAACLFFRDEAPLGEGVEGDEAFQRAYLALHPKAASGDSLADFQLYGRLFKNRCSTMIYSQAFRVLPERVKSAVYLRMREVLLGSDPPADYAHLKVSEKRRIVRILDETHPGWRK